MQIPNSLLTPTLPKTPHGGAIGAPRARPRRVILKNGMRVVYEKSPSTLPLTSIQCFVHMGSVNEPNDVRGISHIIEHMAFKGTPKLPTSIDISKPYDKTGAYMNAYTDKQLTC